MSTKIEWAGETWNPVTGCTRVSDACTNCYIERQIPMRSKGRFFRDAGGNRSNEIGSTTGVMLHPERLNHALLRRRKPTRIFVCSMADLFHEAVPDGFIAQVFTAMAHAPQHTFIVLTKRSARMRSFLTRWYDNTGDAEVAWGGGGLPPMPRGPEAVRAVYSSPRAKIFADMLDSMGTPPEGAAYPLYDWQEGQVWWPRWPLLNVWVGVTAESQKWADIRIPDLLETPAAVRWVSYEPATGPLDLAIVPGQRRPLSVPSVDWLVCGGETGPGSRPMHPGWVRTIRDQCVRAGIPFFFKQWGDWCEHPLGTHRISWGGGWGSNPATCLMSNQALVSRVGKQNAGRLLDGREWNEFPQGGAL